jgi:hypothetical protein
LIRFFEKEQIIKNMKTTGIINKKGTLISHMRTREIRKQESEFKLGLANSSPSSSRLKKFNIKEQLKSELNHLADKNLIIQPMTTNHLTKKQSSKFLEGF